jgi:CheY-specific phosphatase CheX
VIVPGPAPPPVAAVIDDNSAAAYLDGVAPPLAAGNPLWASVDRLGVDLYDSGAGAPHMPRMVALVNAAVAAAVAAVPLSVVPLSITENKVVDYIKAAVAKLPGTSGTQNFYDAVDQSAVKFYNDWKAAGLPAGLGQMIELKKLIDTEIKDEVSIESKKAEDKLKQIEEDQKEINKIITLLGMLWGELRVYYTNVKKGVSLMDNTMNPLGAVNKAFVKINDLIIDNKVIHKSGPDMYIHKEIIEQFKIIFGTLVESKGMHSIERLILGYQAIKKGSAASLSLKETNVHLDSKDDLILIKNLKFPFDSHIPIPSSWESHADDKCPLYQFVNTLRYIIMVVSTIPITLSPDIHTWKPFSNQSLHTNTIPFDMAPVAVVTGGGAVMHHLMFLAKVLVIVGLILLIFYVVYHVSSFSRSSVCTAPNKALAFS